MTRALAAALAAVACCPTVAGPPGDEQAQAWMAPADVPSATPIACPTAPGELRIMTPGAVLSDCVVRGSVRVMGPARNGNAAALRDRSHAAGYVAWLRAAAPSHVRLERVTIEGQGTIPLYVAPGATYTQLYDVTITGWSRGPLVYLGAESSRTHADGLTLAGQPGEGKPALAIDASDSNRVEGRAPGASVQLYRNCGEGGVTRHTTPSYNTIALEGAIVTENARQGGRCYCVDDAGNPWGSSASDLDHARGNVVR